jgi:acyl-CoA thioesterase FadM
MAYEFDWKLRAADTDFSRRVYTPAVLDYTVRAINQLMEDIDHSAYQIHEREGLLYPIAHAEIDYLEAIEVGDLVTISLSHAVGSSSITFEAVGRRDGVEVFEAEVVVVFVDDSDGRSVPVPDAVRARLGDRMA